VPRRWLGRPRSLGRPSWAPGRSLAGARCCAEGIAADGVAGGGPGPAARCIDADVRYSAATAPELWRRINSSWALTI
jgi:hypothetical protein